uniref:Uncharacterized protein n=1 Tax=viral metagenome TaxID=1070528 RepID=A0A6M3IWN1_9ZZZZ
MATNSKYQDEFLIRIYDMARQGKTDIEISKALNITRQTLRVWTQDIDAVKDALEKGRTPLKNIQCISFRDYVYTRLSPELKELWDRLHLCEKEKNGILKIETLLKNAGVHARQHIFIYALIVNNFSVSAACRVANISRVTFHEWKKNKDFTNLVDWLHECKKDFFEDALVNLVKTGDTAATIFANKTLNRDRGYDDKQRVEFSGDVKFSHDKISLDDLDVDLETKKKLLTQIQKRKQAEHIEE